MLHSIGLGRRVEHESYAMRLSRRWTLRAAPFDEAEPRATIESVASCQLLTGRSLGRRRSSRG